MGDIIKPLEASSEGLIESVKDNTSAEGMIFFHADEGKPLATPWQVALSRAILLNKYNYHTKKYKTNTKISLVWFLV